MLFALCIKNQKLTGKYSYVRHNYYKHSFILYLFTVQTCGALWTPRHGHKSSRQYIVGTRVKFFCEPGYLLRGDMDRYCTSTGEWNEPEEGMAWCVGK